MNETPDYTDMLRDEIASDPSLAEAIEMEAFSANVAEQIYEARTRAGMTQKQLAKLADTQQSVIARMEDSDYSGHSLRMLQRIAKALNKRVYIEFRQQFTQQFLESSPPVSIPLGKITWGNALAPWTPTINTQYASIGDAEEWALGV